MRRGAGELLCRHRHSKLINGSGAVKAASVRVVSRRKQIENGTLFSVRQAAAACDVSPPVVRRWLSLDLLSSPPWTVEQLQSVRDVTDPQRHRLGLQRRPRHHDTVEFGPAAALGAAKCKAMPPGHAVGAKHKSGCPPEVRQRLLDAIYAGQSFRRALGDLGLTSNQIWGLTKTDEE
jgi:hypothetical protein